ncbi:MAG: hypothetical protein L0H53_00550 [Candidatus Nitrosocosmicus sp.]|nr:hypothetical protein [Candidatus Nitrosocosmicus sp.]MDN5866026.1 hypothetical protein [Candidatus Nitrosocosmicus sp.]
MTSHENNMMTSIYDHLKISILQSSKGARVEVTYDRSDHDLDIAVSKSVELYKKTIEALKTQNLKVDDNV